MPVQVSYPGVYVTEIPSTPATVTSATTSATAFADFFLRGPMGQAVQVNNLTDFNRTFGGLSPRSEASYGIMQYFNNGGQIAWVVRLGDGTAKVSKLSVQVNLPTASALTSEAANAAVAAAQAAQAAQKATVQPQAYDAASQAAAATQQAANATLQAASATGAMSQELQQDIDEFSAKYGPEAGATRDAAQAAADAAAAAADAAQAASDAAQAASAAANPLNTAPANNAQPQAAKDTGTDSTSGTAQTETAAKASIGAALSSTEVSDLKTASTSGDYSQIKLGESGTAVTPFTDAQKVQTDLTSAISSASGAAKTQLQGLTGPVKSLLDAASAAVQSASDATAAAETASTDVAAAATDPPTVSVQTAASDISATVSAAQDLGSQLTSLSTAAANALAALQQSGLDLTSTPGSTLLADLQALTGDSTASPPTTGSVAAAQQGAGATLGWAQWAEAAVTYWLAAEEEADDLSDAGASSAATTAQGLCNAAYSDALTLQGAASAAQLSALYPGKSGAPDLPTMITELQTAAQAFASSSPSQASQLTATNTELAAIAAAAKAGWTTASAGSSGSGNSAVTFSPTLQQQAAAFAVAAEAAYLSGLIAQDVATAVAPLDAAQNASVQAAAAAQEAARKAAVAVSKARLAELAAQEDQADAGNDMTISAANPGTWGNNLQVQITSRPGYTFDLVVQEMAVKNGQLQAVNTETYTGLTLASSQAANYAVSQVNSQSQLIQLSYGGLTIQGTYPSPTTGPVKLAGGTNGNPPGASDLFPALQTALDNIAPSVFNLLCLPITATYSAGEASEAITDAMSYASSQHAFYIVDIPASVDSVQKMQSWAASYTNAQATAGAVYFPRLTMPDPLQNYRPRNVGASGTLAGIYATNDVDYGVWETPAGINAVLENAQPAVKLTDSDNGILNPLGINCLRTFPVYGNVVWGGRTMAGADLIGSQWKYINVRRLADYIEQSLAQSLRWVVFQDNGPRLWSQIRTQVGSFMSGLYSAGAFAGSTPTQAYLVQVDSSTTTQTDIDNGIVNILVGFAPEKPAEFVVLQIEQLAGQTSS